MYTGDCESSDDGFSFGVEVVISIIVGTFVITLVVTSLISVIITRMYYKHQLAAGKNSKNANTLDNSQFILMNQDVKMDANPAYAVSK